LWCWYRNDLILGIRVEKMADGAVHCQLFVVVFM
jgi:hypothetical protein